MKRNFEVTRYATKTSNSGGIYLQANIRSNITPGNRIVQEKQKSQNKTFIHSMNLKNKVSKMLFP